MRYRKKPVVVEAMVYDGSLESGLKITRWAGGPIKHAHEWLEVETLEGTMFASPGDYIIKGVQGEFYPCKPAIFFESYEEVE